MLQQHKGFIMTPQHTPGSCQIATTYIPLNNPAMKCCQDNLFHITKLSLYMDNPAEIHYHALFHICQYLSTSITEGIYYWRKHPVPTLPMGILPICCPDNYTLSITPTDHPDTLFGYVDSDWAPGTQHHHSVTGVALMYAGGVVGYQHKISGNHC